MKRQEAIHLIDSTFNKAFDEDGFTLFIKNFLNDIDTSKYNEYKGNLIKDAFKDHVSQYKRIGKYIDPNGEALDVLLVEVKDQSKLDRARTALRNFVISHLDSFEKDYALVAFYSKSDHGADWRFSYVKLEYRSEVKEGKIKQRKELTPAKRYSFLVGELEQSHTAKSQLLPLLQNVYNNPTLEQIEEAFSIESVTDEFFEQYKLLFSKLVEQFDRDKTLLAELSKNNIDTSRFAKKLLGQIVFLYFLQKKGWMGVPKNEVWGKGDKRFLQTLFDQAVNKEQNFFAQYLQVLFYEALAKEHSDEGVKGYFKKLNCRIPFLNGGLFEADYDWQSANITIPNALFRNDEPLKSGDTGTGILDVFDRYNFTIKEDEPLEKEVAVDPEMLGKVFENMLEVTERKSKGAFYTPREIVHYMCQESLIYYLDNSVNDYNTVYQGLGNDQLALLPDAKKGKPMLNIEHKDIKVPRADIEEFIRHGFFGLENDQRVIRTGKETSTYKFQLPESVRTHADVLDKHLSTIKICDPAIGSGAFPVGLLLELVNAQLVLRQYLSPSYFEKKLKSLGLTNADYEANENSYLYRLKRHTIQESIYGVDIDASAIDVARLRLWLSLVVDEEDLDHIEALPNLDYKIVCGNSLVGLPIGYEPRWLDELEEIKEKFFECTDNVEKTKLRIQINEKLYGYLENSERSLGYHVDFDFKLFFSEVWHEQEGFDLVIGNPPYRQIQKLDEQDKLRLKRQQFDTFKLTGDLYEIFYEKGWRILNNAGHLCYITSNKWLRASYGESTRHFFLNKTNPKLLFDFGQEMIFNSAIVHSNILITQQSDFKNEFKGCQMTKGKVKNLSLAEYFSRHSINLDYFNDEVWAISSPMMIEIKKSLEKNGTKLEYWDINIFRGLLTGYNDAFFINGEKRDELIKQDRTLEAIIKPILRGRDIRRYYLNIPDLYIINAHNGSRDTGIPRIDVPKDHPVLFDYLKSFPNGIQTRADQGSHWTNLRNCSFLSEIEKEKITYSEIVSEPQFHLDKEKFFHDNTAFIITGSNLKWLIAFLNSNPITTIFRVFYAGGELVGKYRYKKAFLEKIPIPEPIEKFRQPIETLVEYLTFYKGTKGDSSRGDLVAQYFELLTDALAYEVILSDQVRNSGKEICKHVSDLKPISEDMSAEKKLTIIQSEFNRLYDPNHPVRIAIETLDSVEEVRTIREALR